MITTKEELLIYIRQQVEEIEAALSYQHWESNKRVLLASRDTYLDIYDKLIGSAELTQEDIQWADDTTRD